MPERPQASDKFRILLFDNDLRAARPILAGIAEASMDGRFTPMGPGAAAAITGVNPHLIVLTLLNPPDATFKVIDALGKISAAPVVVTVPSGTDAAVLQALNFVAVTATYDRDKGDAGKVLRIIGEQIQAVYGAETMLSGKVVRMDIDLLPSGWGGCEECGYLGPRLKFEDANWHSSHSLTCPCCKHHDRVVFAVR